MGTYTQKTESTFVDEALRLVKVADERGITLRVMGAVAFRIHCPKFKELYKALKRELTDIDLMGRGGQGHKIERLFEDLGYEKRRPTMAFHMGRRQKYFDRVHNRAVDVFLDELKMSHTINFRRRLDIDYPTVPLAELLLEKIQIAQLTEKDVMDCMVLLREHRLGRSDDETINTRHIAKILSNDWGFYYTVTENLKKIQNFLPKYEVLERRGGIDIRDKIDEVLRSIIEEPKTLRWKMRAKVGTRKKWYREVDVLEG